MAIQVKRAGHPQEALGLRRQAADGSLGVLVRLEALETALEIRAPCLRYAHAARGPIEEPDAVPLFDCSDMLGHRGARHAQIRRGFREARALRDAGEDTHHLQGVHAGIVALFLGEKQSVSIPALPLLRCRG